ncbi:MAG: metallophosphoesterase [Elusimicrobia bacterium]|nr:metallophosphoesterase [Elusimicrobiota bacterium]
MTAAEPDRRWRTPRQLGLLPERAAGESFEFAVIGDVEPCRFGLVRLLFNRPRVFARHLRALRTQSADFIVQLGDMVGRGSETYYRRFLAELSDLGLDRPYLTVPGNHDRSRPNGPSDSRLYRGFLGPCNYAFDHGPARFVALDTSARRLRPAQLRWLARVLDTPRRKIIFTHMPPAQLSLWGGSIAHFHGGFSRGARQFAELAAAKKVSRVYVGHIHAFGVQDYLGVRYVLSGGGGSALFPSGAPDRYHHYLTVEVSAEGVRERVHPLGGRAFSVPAAPVILPSAVPDWPRRARDLLRRAGARIRESGAPSCGHGR